MCRFANNLYEHMPLLAVSTFPEPWQAAGCPKSWSLGKQSRSGFQPGMMDVLSEGWMYWACAGTCSIWHFCVFCLLPKGWVRNSHDLQIILRVLAVGGGNKRKSWFMVVSSGWKDMELWGKEVKCAGDWEWGAVSGSLCRIEIRSPSAVISGEQESWRKLCRGKRRLEFLSREESHRWQVRNFSDSSVLGSL